jgi:quercetin dioxygenase-like cupin family protein
MARWTFDEAARSRRRKAGGLVHRPCADRSARTARHTDPLGQTLVVTAGCGRVRREGGPVETIRPGDVIWFSPGERHWRGATPTTAMRHIAVQEKLDGKVADWMGHVGDDDYGA